MMGKTYQPEGNNLETINKMDFLNILYFG
jgi:hypothetical protein